jgi:uncharacterized protein YhfF
MRDELGTLESFAFGDSPEMADELLALVLAGTKTATCGPLREYESEAAPLPRPGQRNVVLDGRGTPACVIEITGVDCKRFDTVDAEFACAEGEGELSLFAWQEIHESFFRRHGGFSPDMILVCERFRVIERLNGTARL